MSSMKDYVEEEMAEIEENGEIMEEDHTPLEVSDEEMGQRIMHCVCPVCGNPEVIMMRNMQDNIIIQRFYCPVCGQGSQSQMDERYIEVGFIPSNWINHIQAPEED